MEYPLAPFLLAMVLGNMLETSFRQSMAISRGEFSIFFERPFSATLMVLFIVVLVATVFFSLKKKMALAESAAP
jgi:putative tricarboxylic transport membrane protein